MDKITVALVAHDNMKNDLAQWVDLNREKLSSCELVCTGTTGRIVREMLEGRDDEGADKTASRITLLKSGPLGGDQQLGSRIAEGKIDVLVFFWDPMQAQPHDVDVKALLRLATLYNVPTAVNRSTANYIITSPLFHNGYEPDVKDYSGYISRQLE